MNKITQAQLAIRIVRKNGKIVPAKRCGTAWDGMWIGSEICRTCRQLRQEKLLYSPEEREDNKYTIFLPTKKLLKIWQKK